MTEEQAEQLKAIRRARELGILPWSHLSNPTQRFEIARDTLDFLLSLLTTQSQSSLSQLMTDEDECIAREQAALEAGGTRMRDACVEKVKTQREKFQQAADSSSLPNDLTASRDAAVAAAFTRLLADIQSLTLDQVEQEKR